MLDRAFAEDFARRWLEAWNALDGAAVAGLCTPGVEFTDPALGTVHGRPAVAHWVETCARGFPDLRFEAAEPVYVASDRPKLIGPWRVRGTNSGPLDPPGFAATGRPIDLVGVDHGWIEDGLVARYRGDYDTVGLLRQLGLAPAPGSRAERAAVALQRVSRRIAARAS